MDLGTHSNHAGEGGWNLNKGAFTQERAARVNSMRNFGGTEDSVSATKPRTQG